ncbi:MAG: DMT family transporter [Bacillota bacterium]
MKQDHIGVLLVILSSVCYGFMAIFVKFAYAGQANLATVLSSRFVLASLFLWLIVIVGKTAVTVTRKDLLSLLLLSIVGYGIASTFFFASLLFIPASLASLILFIHPVMVTIYETVFYRYPLGLKKAAALVLSTAGLFLVMGNISGEVNIRGALLAMGAAFSYTIYLLYGKKVVGKHSPVLVTAFVLTFAAAGFSAYGLAFGEIDLSFPLYTWVWILAVAAVSTCMGILFLFAGLKRLEAGKASILSTFEVIITVSFSTLLLGDVMTPAQIAGGAAILAGIVILRMQPGENGN